MSGGKIRTPEVSFTGARIVVPSQRFSRRLTHRTTNMMATTATTPRTRLTRPTVARTTSRLVPSVVTKNVSAPYHNAEARASGINARGADSLAIPANGGTTARHTGKRREMK